ncbi:hypothetical protein A8B79_02965 [Balneola sp. EhC07]|nr:hypothetical protein A8B79_02965 [Balneola sp. EhC07]
MLIKVGMGEKLANQDYTLIDYNFVLANSDSSDKLYFEFVTNKELTPSTVITFLDKSGKLFAAKEAGSASSLIGEGLDVSGEKSFVYSVSIDDLRSVSLLHKVNIGK